MNDFMKRTLALMSDKKIKARHMCPQIGITESAFSQWKAGSNHPTAANKQKLATFLGTSLDYLETGVHKKHYAAVPLIKTKKDIEAFGLSISDTFFNAALKTLADNSSMSKGEAHNRFAQLENSHCMNRFDKPGLFAWVLENDSMMSLTPDSYWPQGAQILFDPRKKPLSGKCIFLVIDGVLYFRRWVEVEGVHVFSMINPAYAHGTALQYTGNIWDVWLGTPVSYMLPL